MKVLLLSDFSDLPSYNSINNLEKKITQYAKVTKISIEKRKDFDNNFFKKNNYSFDLVIISLTKKLLNYLLLESDIFGSIYGNNKTKHIFIIGSRKIWENYTELSKDKVSFFIRRGVSKTSKEFSVAIIEYLSQL